jgi:phosphonate transport system ATP-binding protein
MAALQRINRHYGPPVLCNIHSLDLARSYCDRLVGMAGGRVVFDGVPAELTEDVARELYGMEANEVLAPAKAPVPEPALAEAIRA